MHFEHTVRACSDRAQCPNLPCLACVSLLTAPCMSNMRCFDTSAAPHSSSSHTPTCACSPFTGHLMSAAARKLQALPSQEAGVCCYSVTRSFQILKAPHLMASYILFTPCRCTNQYMAVGGVLYPDLLALPPPAKKVSGSVPRPNSRARPTA